MSDSSAGVNYLVPFHGGVSAPYAPGERFTEGVTRHHRPFYSDYEVAKQHIMQAIGDLADFDLFGSDVLCAIFIRPNITPGGLHLPLTEIKEDWFQTKTVLVLKVGPDAWRGDEKYLNARFGPGVTVPVPGEWLVANANSGIQINLMGTGGTRPQGSSFSGAPFDLFEWDGWPCRVIGHDHFRMRLTKPHSIV